MADASSTNATTEEGVVIERIFDAPRELVWKAWTEPEGFKRWYGPQGFTVPVCEIDLQVGGRKFFGMQSPQGQSMWYVGEFKEIDQPGRLIFSESLADEQGNVVPMSHYGMPGDAPFETLVTVTLEEVDGRTKMTMRQEGLPAGAASEGATMGWNQAFDKLAEVLAS